MKTFKDLKFERHSLGHGVIAGLSFSNGYSVSVIKTTFSYGGSEGLYELAILNEDNKIDYNTGIMDDVLGHLTKFEVSEYMKRVQKLKKYESKR